VTGAGDPAEVSFAQNKEKGSNLLLAQLGNKNHQYKSPADRASPDDDAESKIRPACQQAGRIG